MTLSEASVINESVNQNDWKIRSLNIAKRNEDATINQPLAISCFLDSNKILKIGPVIVPELATIFLETWGEKNMRISSKWIFIVEFISLLAVYWWDTLIQRLIISRLTIFLCCETCMWGMGWIATPFCHHNLSTFLRGIRRAIYFSGLSTPMK